MCSSDLFAQSWPAKPVRIVVPTGAVRDEGQTRYYAPKRYPAVADFDVVGALVAAARDSGHTVHTGIIRTTDGFYPSQRIDRYVERYHDLGVLSVEQEVAAILTDLKLEEVIVLRAEAVASSEDRGVRGSELPGAEARQVQQHRQREGTGFTVRQQAAELAVRLRFVERTDDCLFMQRVTHGLHDEPSVSGFLHYEPSLTAGFWLLHLRCVRHRHG